MAVLMYSQVIGQSSAKERRLFAHASAANPRSCLIAWPTRGMSLPTTRSWQAPARGRTRNIPDHHRGSPTPPDTLLTPGRQPLLGDHHPTEHELQITVSDTPGVICVRDAASASRDPADSHALAAGLAPFSLSWAAGPDGESADNGSL